MDNFKSFNDFRRELHENKEPVHAAPKPEDTEMLYAPAEEEAPKVESPPHEPKRRRRKIKLSYLLIGAGAILVLGSILFLPLPIGNISISGNTQLTVDDVIFEGEIRQPVNVLQVSASDLEERLRHDVRVADVTVTRKFPLTVEVAIEDRRPLAVVQGEYSYAIIDKDGLVIDSVQAIRAADVPMITGKRLGNLLLGDHVDQEDIKKALTFLNGLTADGQKVFSEINIGNTNQIMAYTRDGITVRLGDGSDIEERAKLAENMVGDVKARGLSVEYLDANLTSPFIKLKK